MDLPMQSAVNLARTQRRSGLARLPGRLGAFEVFIALHLVVTVFLLRAHHMNLGWQAVAYSVPKLLVSTLEILGYGFLAYIVWCLARRRPLRSYFRRIRTAGWLLLTLRIYVGIVAAAFGYMWLKVSIPLINERLWDRQLWNLDVWLHGGISPSLFLTGLFQGTILVTLVDWWYASWLWTSLIGMTFFCCFPQARVRRQVIYSHLLLWIAGVWLYLAIPALGPVYVRPSDFAEVRKELPINVGSQDKLWVNYQKVLEGRDGPVPQLNPTRGIASMPSLHVAAHWLLMLWARRRARPLFMPFALATAATFVASIVTGWHYAVDGYAGIVLAQLVYWVSLRVPQGNDSGLTRITRGLRFAGENDRSRAPVSPENGPGAHDHLTAARDGGHRRRDAAGRDAALG
jgi:hypothetical protein